MPIDFEDTPESLAALEKEFEAACWDAIAECERLKIIRKPIIWIGMIRSHGAAEAARRLVVSGDVQSGFQQLMRAGRPDITVEWAILNPKWDRLFNARHREAARWRLGQVEPPR